MESEEWYETEYEGLTVTRSGRFKWYGEERVPEPCEKKYKNSCWGIKTSHKHKTYVFNAAAVMYKVFVGAYDYKKEVLKYKDGNKANYMPENLYTVKKDKLYEEFKMRNRERNKKRYYERRSEYLKFLDDGNWRLSEIEGLYVCRDGRFFKNGRFLTPYKSGVGNKYENCAFYVAAKKAGSKRLYLRADELVYKTWVGTIDSGKYIMHKDGDSSNINVDNLFLCDARDYWKMWGDKRRGKKTVSKEDYIEELRTQHIEVHLAIDYALTDDMTAYNKYIVETIIPYAEQYCKNRFNLSQDRSNEIISYVMSDLFDGITNRRISFVKRYVRYRIMVRMKMCWPSLKKVRVNERPSLSAGDIRLMAEAQLHLGNEDKYMAL